LRDVLKRAATGVKKSHALYASLQATVVYKSMEKGEIMILAHRRNENSEEERGLMGHPNGRIV
jgi:hypothetical protein